MNELVATYIFDPNVKYGVYEVIACYDSMDDYDKRKVSFYDVYDKSGLCVNEGDPFYDMPSWKDIYEFYWIPSIMESDQTHKRDLGVIEEIKDFEGIKD